MTHDRYTREAIRELQQKIETLEAELGEKQYPQALTSRSPALHRRNTHFVGDGNGLEYAVHPFKARAIADVQAFSQEYLGLHVERTPEMKF